LGIDFSEDDKRAMLKRLAPLQIRKQPMAAKRKSFPKARWVKPIVLIDAEFRGKTGEGLLRHPSYKRLSRRSDDERNELDERA
jgi:bifunctional non-homologous end joining protein LigD